MLWPPLGTAAEWRLAMFEDSTFDSTGKIKTRSRRWMVVTLAINGTILLILVLMPLIYPDALPQHMMPSLLVAPEAPKPEVQTEPVRVQPARPHNFPEFDQGRLIAPGVIPRTPLAPTGPELPFIADNLGGDSERGVIGGTGQGIFNGQRVTVVHPPVPASIHLSSKLVEGNIIYKSVPQYPAIAKVVGAQGIVVLQAMISKTGTIENLHVISGPQMLQQAAIDAVKSWRYRPYMLNGQAVEVETTVNVIFKLER
jgi:periplasmic protein TonB